MWKSQLLPAIIFLTVATIGPAQNCLPEGLTISTQAQLDSFAIQYPQCSHILGDLRIKEAAPGAITKLDGLGQISHIGGSLLVWSNKELTSLNGLNQLRVIDQHLSVNGNKALISLAGLEKLDSIHGSFGLIRNAALSTLNGLNLLKAVGENLEITANPMLVNFNGLDNLRSIGAYLKVLDNDALLNLRGLEQLSAIGGDFTVKNNLSLASLNGLDQLTGIGGNLDVQYNPSLTDDASLNKVGVAGTEVVKGQKINPHITFVYKTGKSSAQAGYLRGVKEDGILLSNYVLKSSPDYTPQYIPVQDIKTLKFRERGKPIKGALIGFLTGLVIGGAVGYLRGDDDPASCWWLHCYSYSANEKALRYGVGFAIPLGILGLSLNLRKISIPINGNQHTLQQNKKKLLKYQMD